MESFLNARKVSRAWNFQSLKKGKYLIKPEDKDEFFTLFTQTPLKKLRSLAFTPKGKIGHLYIDIDIVLSSENAFEVEGLYRIADIAKYEILKIKPDYDPVISITCRPKPYFKKKHKNIPAGWRSGGHIFFHGWFTKSFCEQIYNQLLVNQDLIDLMKDPRIVNPLADILDKSPIIRSNGLMLVNDHKPKNMCPPHELIVFENTENNMSRITPEQMDGLYHWLFEQPDESDIVYDFTPTTDEQVFKPVKPIQHISKKKMSKSTFNLKLFLELTKSHIPSNEEYKQLCVYFDSEGLDPKNTGQITNEYWNPDRPFETERFMSKLTYHSCGIGSAINYLTVYAPMFNRNMIDQVFGKNRQRFNFYTDVELFTLAKGGVWSLDVIHQYFQDVFSFIHGDASFRFVYKEEKICTAYDQDIMQVNTCVVTESPFHGVANLTIMCHQSRESLFKRLKYIKPPKQNKLKLTSPEDCDLQKRLMEKHKIAQERFQKAQLLLALEDDADIDSIRKCLGSDADPVKQKIHRLFMDYHEGRYLDSYRSFTYKPYVGKDPTPRDMFNIFPGFYLEDFRNTRVDIKETSIWQWLWFAMSNQREHKLNFLLDYLAAKIQCPTKKTKKILIIFGDLNGTGKTSIRYVLQALYGVEAVRFCENMKQFESKFNCLSLGRLFCIVDDIERWSKVQTDNLKSKVTNDTFEYRKMRMDPILMPSFEDLICTSNNQTTYIGHNDRRSELIVINECLKATSSNMPKGFSWRKFYHELESLEIMGALFEFLATRDISHVVFNESYRFSETALFEAKLESMISCHRFLIEFFETKYFWNTKEYSLLQLSELVKCETSDEGRIMWVDTKLLFHWYTVWVKNSARNCRSHSRNFLKGLAQIGLNPIRKKWNKTRITAIKLTERGVIQGIVRRYEVPPGMIELDWFHSALGMKNWELLESGNFGTLQFLGDE